MRSDAKEHATAEIWQVSQGLYDAISCFVSQFFFCLFIWYSFLFLIIIIYYSCSTSTFRRQKLPCTFFSWPTHHERTHLTTEIYHIRQVSHVWRYFSFLFSCFCLFFACFFVPCPSCKHLMGSFWALLSLFLLFLAPFICVAQSIPGWDLVWNDEFDGSSLNTNNWTPEYPFFHS
eukprot:Phypoly_transcript_15948.p1 GENE.Phypoly_transcript_15948~~Phypoly_transcript_15948.p1  ORF type:complete len:203 (+),score=8.17 Phypoly_transcript_15948:87-611(+)